MSRKLKATPLAQSISDSGLVFPSPGPSAFVKGKLPIVTQFTTPEEREEFMYHLMSSMPRSQLFSLQRRIAPLLQFDVVSSLPTEVALQIFSHLPPHSLLLCSLVSRRWNVLANDQSLWRALCHRQGWEWRHPSPNTDTLDSPKPSESTPRPGLLGGHEDEDEGMGDSDNEGPNIINEFDSGFASGSGSSLLPSSASIWPSPIRNTAYIQRSRSSQDHSSRTTLPPSPSPSRPTSSPKFHYKRLYRIHTRLRNRFLTSSYRLSVIQTRYSPSNGHDNMIYCVQLYTYPSTNQQVIFTGSRDKTIREWNLKTTQVERVFEGEHTESVLSLCVRDGWMASAGSDWRVVLWSLDKSGWKGRQLEDGATAVVKVLKDHEDSVLCVRFDEERLVSCSKDRTARVYSFPDLELLHVLNGHWAAVNAISLYKNFLVSGSGDRSMNVWDVKTGKLIRAFKDHHTRGIASIDFKPPYIVSGSSDKHIRLIDMNTSQGWSTCPEYDGTPIGLGTSFPKTGIMPLGPTHAPFIPRHLYPQFLYGDLCSCMCQSCGAAVAFPPSTIGEATDSGPLPPLTSTSAASTSAATFGNVAPSIPLSYSQTPLIPHLSPHQHGSHGYDFLPRRISSALTSIFPPSPQSASHAIPHPPPPTPHGITTTTSTPPPHHTDLVRSVTLGPDFVITGSYDFTIKIWDRLTGVLVGDLTGGHTGKVFCVAADRNKIISCGEDMRICVWDFGVGVEGCENIRCEW